jgi:hypothetical protein
VSALNRRPVVFARPRALEQARELIGSRCLENVIRDSIRAGRLAGVRNGQAPVYFDLPDGDQAVAYLSQEVSPFTGRKVWVAVDVKRAPRATEEIVPVTRSRSEAR